MVSGEQYIFRSFSLSNHEWAGGGASHRWLLCLSRPGAENEEM